ncbi:MAG: 3-phosphoshikimate 1-carboxyvinyltransferase [Myxococcales bacterium]|nr:3-phosphoshikimate 1-carboxyvinyltransferase [Myxococcales bacterium]
MRLRVPPSKSVTHRAFLLAAQSATPCTVHHPLLGADCRSTLSVLAGLGARFAVGEAQVRFEPVVAFGGAQGLDCGNSGTTLRLLSAFAATLPGRSSLSGDASLQGRPNGPLLAALESLGATVGSRDGRAPLTIQGPIGSGEAMLSPRVSSQYASGLALALARLPGGGAVVLQRPVASRPYLDITVQVAQAFGLTLAVVEDAETVRLLVPGGQRVAAAEFTVEADWSSAAFPLVGAALLGRALALEGLNPGSPQGDRVVADQVERFGPQVQWQGRDLRLAPAPLRAAGTLDLGACPDLFPALVALAAAAPGTTVFTGAPSLRHKESDRIAAMARGLEAVGVPCEERPDGLVVHGGGARQPAAIACHHDHRIHMAFRLLSAAGPRLAVDSPGCEAVSYPEFNAHLAALAG